MQDDAAYKLDVVMAHAEDTLGRLAHQGKDFRQDVVQCFCSVLDQLPVFSHANRKVCILQLFHLWFECIDLLHQGAQFL